MTQAPLKKTKPKNKTKSIKSTKSLDKKLVKKTNAPARAGTSAKVSAKTINSSLRNLIGKTNLDIKGKLLVLMDETTESITAMRFAAISAKRLNSNLALLMVLEPQVVRHWLGVETIMKEEARQRALEKMQTLISEITDYAHVTPDLLIREGTKFEVIVKLVAEDSDITALVIGVPSSEHQPHKPGPLVNKLLLGELERLGLPMIIVPENISDRTVKRIARII